jgi:hypothetical protein
VIIGAICYQIATKNMASGFGAEAWGSAPSLSHLFAVVSESCAQTSGRAKRKSAEYIQLRTRLSANAQTMLLFLL